MSAPAAGCSRPSKNNRQDNAHRGERPESLEPADLPGGTALRPLAVEEGRTLRDEAVLELSEGPQARPWYAVLNQWREWYADYRSMHVEYENNGETVRTQLENSYQPEYGKRYYARLKDLERGIERTYEGLTTAMLTFSASTLNQDGTPRCPADHMREIADGWDTARKQLHQVLSGENWEYAKVWEPHSGGTRGPGGYGHLHVAVFVEDGDDLDADLFQPVLNSYVSRCGPAGQEAHTVDEAVSVNDNVENLGSYISEYIGIFGDETLNRPVTEQMFYAVTWATGTRRLDFSNGGQEIIAGEKFRRETGLRPEDRGCGGESDTETAESDESGGWEVSSICTVRRGSPEYADPTGGGADTTEIDGRSGVDPPPEL